MSRDFSEFSVAVIAMDCMRRTELAVLRQLMACRSDMAIAVAAEEGLTLAHFYHLDHRLIAAAHTREARTQAQRLRMALMLLHTEGLYDRTELAAHETSERWNEKKVVAVCQSVTFDAGALRAAVRDLLSVRRHVDELEAESGRRLSEWKARERGKGLVVA